jgi:MFS family permease
MKCSWGAAAMSTGAVNNFSQLLVCRCLLGIFESIFGAGAPYFLSLFYQRKELGFRVSLLLGMSPVANCFASALAYGITQIKGSLKPWRYLFIIGKCNSSTGMNLELTIRRGRTNGSVCHRGLSISS